MTNINSAEIYEQVNSRILNALAKGTVPWQRPWVGELSAPRNLQSGKPYRGINTLLLGLSEYNDPRWTTFNAARRMDGKVRKGEKSTLVVLWKRIKVKDTDAPNGEKVIPILRYFRVFNVEQVDWPEGAIQPLAAEPAGDWNPLDAAEDVLQGYLNSDDAPALGYGGSQAFYRLSDHMIMLPERDSFTTQEGFYKTAFHECVHSTSKLVGRELSKSFGSEKYGREELVAEMGGAFVTASVGVEVDYDNSAAYIKNWQQVIQDDPKMLVKAAGQAQRAADRILGVTFETEEK